ncbi:MAG: hypothetical protein K2L97_02660 [Muribaculaceae bacterium]|nr:hypothetical protein [Muribaculaceae bacterium]
MHPEITHIIASLIASPPGDAKTISVKEAVEIALATPPRRYGLTTEYALRRFRAMRRGKAPRRRDLSSQMWDEFARKVDRRMQLNPAETDFDAVEHILSCDAPSRYYITPAYAEKRFYHRKRLSHSKKQ